MSCMGPYGPYAALAGCVPIRPFLQLSQSVSQKAALSPYVHAHCVLALSLPTADLLEHNCLPQRLTMRLSCRPHQASKPCFALIG